MVSVTLEVVWYNNNSDLLSLGGCVICFHDIFIPREKIRIFPGVMVLRLLFVVVKNEATKIVKMSSQIRLLNTNVITRQRRVGVNLFRKY